MPRGLLRVFRVLRSRHPFETEFLRHIADIRLGEEASVVAPGARHSPCRPLFRLWTYAIGRAPDGIHCIEYGIVKADPRVWGSFVWVMYDFASDNRDEGDRRGINDKGLVTRDRKVMKDAYWFYKANWNPEPMLWLSGKRLVKADADKVMVRGFSNVGDVTLVLNGRPYGTLTPDAVKTVTWRNVPLVPGVNTIELRAGGRTDSCSWLWTGDSGGSRNRVEK